MDKLLVLFAYVCCFALVAATELTIHDYDVQIHPIHGHHGHYGEHHGGYATSVRYDKRYHHKIPAAPEYHQDVVYQYVADGYEDDDEGHFHGY